MVKIKDRIVYTHKRFELNILRNFNEKKFLLLSSASEGTVSRRSSRPRALVARVSCNLYTDLK